VEVVGDGPQQVQHACQAAVAVLVAAMPSWGVTGSRAQWAAAVGAAQQVANVAAAVQDAAIARLAAIEPQWLEDGTLVESHRALGHLALDAPAIVSGVLSVAPVHAERRVRSAARLVAGTDAGSDIDAGSDTDTDVAGSGGSGLGGLHAAMAAGVLDSYRAGVLADELEFAPAEVAASVVAALGPFFGVEDAAHLRRRCRRVLARISPDLLLQRAKKARAGCGLRRWAEEPGVDRWEGTFPSEDAAQAWAAIDALAHQYVNDGTCTVLEQARAKALTDLVTANATIEAVITLTVPATIVTASSAADTTGAGSDGCARGAVPEPCPSSDARVESVTPGPGEAEQATAGTVRAEAPVGEVGRAEPAGPDDPAATDHVMSGAGSADGDHTAEDNPRPEAEDNPRPAAGEPALVARDSDLVEVSGLAGNQLVLVPHAWVSATIAEQRATDPGKVTTAPCHPVTGALTDPDGQDPDGANAEPGAGRYRPSQPLVRQVKARDRRCRFPGCTVAAVFCDVDHVRPWPAGPTTMTNLVCLCRRHHRTKQRPGWHTTLHPDGTLTWTDPTGTVRTSAAVDALHPTVLPDTMALTGPTGPRHTTGGHTTVAVQAAPADETPSERAAPTEVTSTTSRARTVLADAPHSDLEFSLEHRTAGLPWTPTGWHDDRGQHRIELTPTTHDVIVDDPADPPGHPCRNHRTRRDRRPGRRTEHDPPPF
jgi:hypothetical protein